MAVADTFLGLSARVTPRWMKRPKVRALVSQIYAQADQVVDRLAGGIVARCLELAPDDALDAIGATYDLERAPGESAAGLRAYLRNPFGRWYKGGTVDGLGEQLVHLGLLSAQIVTYWDLVDLGVPPDVAFGGNTSFFFVLIPYPNVFTDPKIWDGGLLLGGFWGGGTLWGLGDPTGLLPSITRTIAKWKEGGTSCRFVVIARDANFAMNARWGEVNWGAFNWGAGFAGSYEIIPMMEPWEIGSNGAQTREFYNYSYTRERVT